MQLCLINRVLPVSCSMAATVIIILLRGVLKSKDTSNIVVKYCPGIQHFNGKEL